MNDFNFLDFDASTVAPNTGFDPLPAGKYLVACTAAEQKQTKNFDGSYIKLELTVLEGDAKDRKIWDIFNVNNKNPTAQNIGRAQLSAYYRAAGMTKATSERDLIGNTVRVTLAVKKDEQYGDKNIVKKYESPQAKKDGGEAPFWP